MHIIIIIHIHDLQSARELVVCQLGTSNNWDLKLFNIFASPQAITLETRLPLSWLRDRIILNYTLHWGCWLHVYITVQCMENYMSQYIIYTCCAYDSQYIHTSLWAWSCGYPNLDVAMQKKFAIERPVGRFCSIR